MEVFDEIEGLVMRRGRRPYGDTAVSHEQHMLQAATLAFRDEAPASLVTAALLHDVGQLLGHCGAMWAADAVDDTHPILGQLWLARYFPPAVTEPVRLHVDAKRYLCTVDPVYFAKLSPAALRVLRLQGGLMDEDEREIFEENRYLMAALRLRRYDDMARQPGAATLPLSYFRPYVEASRTSTARAV